MAKNPILMELPLNGSLAGRDRDGVFSASGSGALRYQPAEGARINWVRDPLLTGYDGVLDSGGGTGSSSSVLTDDAPPGGVGYRRYTVTTVGAYLLIGAGSTPVRQFVNELMFSEWVRSSVPLTVHLQHIYFDGTPSYISQSSNEAFVLEPNVWTRVSSIRTPVAGTHFMQVRLSIDVAGLSPEDWIDTAAICLEEDTADASFFIPSIWLDPITGQLGTAHASPSVEHAVAWVEEGTSNLVPNPWRATNNTGWAALNGSTARTTTYAYQGPGAGRLTATAANAEEYISITAAAASHTAQAIVRNNAAATRQCQLTYNGALIGSASNVAAGAQATITAAFTGTGGAANLGVRWIDSANTETFTTYYLGGEQKTYATSPCPAIDSAGTVLTGYSWAGTAHNSVSTRAAAGVRLPAANHVDTIIGSMVIRARITLHRQQRIFEVGAFAGGNPGDSITLLAGASPAFQQLMYSGGLAGNTATQNGLTQGALAHLYGMWTATANGVAIDAAAVSSVARNRIPDGTFMAPFPNISIGVGGAATTAGATLIGPLAIYARPLTDAERALVNVAIDAGHDLWRLLGSNRYNQFQLRPIGA